LNTPSGELRRLFGNFATGVTIVTCRVGKRKHGITVNSFTSVSLDPPLVLICIDRKAIAWEMIPEAGTFAINILTSQQRPVCDYFAKRLFHDPENEFAEIPHADGVTGAPVLEEALAVIECRLSDRYPGGDHDIFVGEVVGAQILRDDAPLLFYRGRFPAIETNPSSVAGR
jgi:flavin reductase (DIM6/NTAB) family NADH-FMN oxidoreductase RutF